MTSPEQPLGKAGGSALGRLANERCDQRREMMPGEILDQSFRQLDLLERQAAKIGRPEIMADCRHERRQQPTRGLPRSIRTRVGRRHVGICASRPYRPGSRPDRRDGGIREIGPDPGERQRDQLGTPRRQHLGNFRRQSVLDIPRMSSARTRGGGAFVSFLALRHRIIRRAHGNGQAMRSRARRVLFSAVRLMSSPALTPACGRMAAPAELFDFAGAYVSE